ncbi:hypothetical protein K4L44_13285 [Halosquirtibacter laminarini]|uniref:Uncharacterized protein n=1 Tax=Halosquirtibacter laminarini TaxID=3374600 RepID=A0AC61NDA0_9BACT|nr:hypothetical protein K4L44_13285 [Prolixibacteraceae bacterium]
MAKIVDSFLSGVIGPVVAYQSGNKQIIRSCPQRSNQSPSEKQIFQRQKIKLSNRLLKPFHSILRYAFAVKGATRCSINRARSLVLRNMVQDDYNKVVIQYENIRMSLDGDCLCRIKSVCLEENRLELFFNTNPTVPSHITLTVLMYSNGVGSYLSSIIYQEDGHYSIALTLDVQKQYVEKKQDIHFWFLFYDPLKQHYYGSIYHVEKSSR